MRRSTSSRLMKWCLGAAAKGAITSAHKMQFKVGWSGFKISANTLSVARGKTPERGRTKCDADMGGAKSKSRHDEQRRQPMQCDGDTRVAQFCFPQMHAPIGPARW